MKAYQLVTVLMRHPNTDVFCMGYDTDFDEPVCMLDTDDDSVCWWIGPKKEVEHV